MSPLAREGYRTQAPSMFYSLSERHAKCTLRLSKTWLVFGGSVGPALKAFGGHGHQPIGRYALGATMV